MRGSTVVSKPGMDELTWCMIAILNILQSQKTPSIQLWDISLIQEVRAVTASQWNITMLLKGMESFY